jgi:hypothetical protein
MVICLITDFRIVVSKKNGLQAGGLA